MVGAGIAVPAIFLRGIAVMRFIAEYFLIAYAGRYFLVVLLMVSASAVYSRPEVIRADISYYSDDYFQNGVVRDIEAEKNYEEIYQFYTYYEVVYDSEKRVKVFREYKRGEIIHEEHYQYDNDVIRRKVVMQKPDQ